MTAEVLEAARRYAALGLCVIPIKPRSKKPDLRRWQQYQDRRPKDEELEGWFSGREERNLAVVCGAVSGGLFVLDFDDPRAFAYVFGKADELAASTTVVRTGRGGVHVYTRAKDGEAPPKTSLRRAPGRSRGPDLPVDVQGEGSYVVAPPSVHESGKRYELLGTGERILEAAPEEILAELRERAEEWPYVEPVLAGWSEGVRHGLVLGYAAFLRKELGVPEGRAKRIVEGLCRAAGDAEAADRLRAVEDTYRKPLAEISLEGLGPELLAELRRRLPPHAPDSRARTAGRVPGRADSEEPRAGKTRAKMRPSRLRDLAERVLRGAASRGGRDRALQGARTEDLDSFRELASKEQAARLAGLVEDPDWTSGRIHVEAALRWVLEGRDVRVQEEIRVAPGEEEAAARAGRLDLGSAVHVLTDLLAFPDEADPYLVLTWDFQSKIYDLLPACVHLAFVGPSSAGKSRALKAVLACVRGELVSDASEAYVARVLDEGRILGFDEVDRQLWAHRDGMLDSILRQATDPKARRRILEKTGEGEFIPRDLDLYRPCAFTYTGEIDKALTTRTLLIRMEPKADAARVVRNLYPDEDLAALRIWLEDRAAEARSTWTAERVRERMSSPQFLERLDKLKTGLPRDKEVAAILLIAAEIAGWAPALEDRILARIRAGAEDRTTEDEATVKEAMALAPWQKPTAEGGLPWVWQEDVLQVLNERRKILNSRPMQSRRLGRILSDLGLRDHVDSVKVRSEHGKRRILRTDLIETLLSPRPLSQSHGAHGALGASSIWSAYHGDHEDHEGEDTREGQDPDEMFVRGRVRDALAVGSKEPAGYMAARIADELAKRGRTVSREAVGKWVEEERAGILGSEPQDEDGGRRQSDAPRSEGSA